MQTINIAKDFSRTPGTRFKKRSRFSGEQFRDEVLLPALQKDEEVVVVLDGTAGYSGSFLEEAFGGLVRLRVFEKEHLDKFLRIEAHDQEYQFYKELAKSAIENANKEL